MKLERNPFIFQDIFLGRNNKWIILSVPFLMVSKKVKKVMEAYEPNLNFKEIVLLEKKHGKVGDTAVFYVDGVDRKAGIWREDILESILARYAYGFQIKKIEAL